MLKKYSLVQTILIAVSVIIILIGVLYIPKFLFGIFGALLLLGVIDTAKAIAIGVGIVIVLAILTLIAAIYIAYIIYKRW